MKRGQIQSFMWFVFSRIRTEYGSEKTPYLVIFQSLSWYLVKTFLLTSKPKVYGRSRIQSEIKCLNFGMKLKELIKIDFS